MLGILQLWNINVAETGGFVPHCLALLATQYTLAEEAALTLHR